MNVIYRKKIKFFLEKFLLPKINQNIIDSNSQQSFSQSINTAIINLSVISWEFRFQRPQQLSIKLSKKNIPVFYIDNEFIISNNHKNPPFTSYFIESNLYKIKLSSTNNYFIYQNTPSKIDINFISNSIKELIKTAKIKNPILKIDHPFWTPIAQKLKLPTIYDCLDDQSQFELNSTSIINSEKILFKIAQKVFVSSEKLFQKASSFQNTKNIILIPNATDYSHFTQKKIIKNHNNLSFLPKPIFGYFGAIEEWLDTDFIEKLARNTNGSIVLIGQNNSQYQPQSKNIILLGEKLYQDLPEFLSQFDSCLLPFKISTLTKAVNPVKIYEYFSQGKSVICSKLPELEKYSELVYFYTPKTNIQKIIDQIKNEQTSLKQKRQKIAQNNTWEQRVDTIISILKNL